MPRSGQKGLWRFVRRTSRFASPTTSVASPSGGIRTCATKEFNHVRVPDVRGPLERRALVDRVPDVEEGAAIRQQPDHIQMAGERGLVKRRGMRVSAARIVPARIFSRVEQQADDIGVAVLCRPCEGEVTHLTVRGRQRPAHLFYSAHGRRDRHVHVRAAPYQRVHRLPLAVANSVAHRGVRVGAVVAQQIDESDLHAAFTGYASGGHERERRVDARRLGARARVEHRSSDVHDVLRKAAVAYRVLGDELQQRRMLEIAGFERDALGDERRVIRQVAAQPVHVAAVDQIDGPAKDRVADPFVVRQLVHGYRLFNGSSFGGRAPCRLAPASGTYGSSNPAITQRSMSPPRLMSPRPTKSGGNISRSPKIGSSRSTYFPDATLPRSTTSQSGPIASRSALADCSSGLRYVWLRRSMSPVANARNDSTVTIVSTDRRPAFDVMASTPPAVTGSVASGGRANRRAYASLPRK